MPLLSTDSALLIHKLAIPFDMARLATTLAGVRRLLIWIPLAVVSFVAEAVPKTNIPIAST